MVTTIKADKVKDKTFIGDLISSEGYRENPYKDIKGYLTGGIGHKMSEKDLNDYRQLKDSAEKASFWRYHFQNDIAQAAKDVETLTEDWERRPTDEQLEVLIDMRFNLGFKGLKNFEQMLMYLENGDAENAADEAINSKWHKDFVKANRGKDEPNLRSRRLESKLRSSI